MPRLQREYNNAGPIIKDFECLQMKATKLFCELRKK